MTLASTIPLDNDALNFIERGLSIAYSYYERAPVFFWAGFALIVLKITWTGLAKVRGKGGD